MRLAFGALLALPVALRVACFGTAGNPALDENLQAEYAQVFIEEFCPDYTSYARVKQ
jgi:hypothetical protein